MVRRSKVLEKWWLEWDPRNKWLQVGGHVRLADGRFDEWLTSPIESVLGPLVLVTISKTKYELGKPAKVDKWLVPHKLKKLFYPAGFTEQWAEELERVNNGRMTRHTPHRDRPVTPLDEMMALDVAPISENVSIASTTAKEPAPKPTRKRAARPKATKPKKQTKNAPSDPLAALTANRKMMPLSAKFNFKEDTDSSDMESDVYQPTPRKVKNPRRAATATKQPKVTKKKTATKKRTRTSGKEEADTTETVLSPAKKAKTVKKKVDKKNNEVISVKLPPKKKQTNKPRGRAKKKTDEKEEASFALSASPIATPKLKKKSTQAQARQNIKLKEAAQLPYQFETPKRKSKTKPEGAFATPSHSKPNISADFRTPKASTNQSSDANIGYKTPVLADENGRPKKKRGFKTPKLGIGAEVKKIKSRKINAKQATTKSSFKTPKKAGSGRKRSTMDDITVGMSENIEDDDEETENYFETH